MMSWTLVNRVLFLLLARNRPEVVPSTARDLTPWYRYEILRLASLAQDDNYIVNFASSNNPPSLPVPQSRMACGKREVDSGYKIGKQAD